MSAGMKKMILLPFLCIILSSMVSPFFSFYKECVLLQFQSDFQSFTKCLNYFKSGLLLCVVLACCGYNVLYECHIYLRLQVRSAVASVRVPPLPLIAQPEWVWFWMVVAVAGSAPNRWGSSALRKTCVTHTRAFTATLEPPLTDALEFVQVSHPGMWLFRTAGVWSESPQSWVVTLFVSSSAREGATCVFGGMVYKSGETFQSSCKYKCTCLDGAVGCVPLCSMDIRLPSPDCPMPRRVKVPGKCCEEWECDSPYTHSVLGSVVLPGKLATCDIFTMTQMSLGDDSNSVSSSVYSLQGGGQLRSRPLHDEG